MRRICFLVHNCADYGGVEAVTSNLANEFNNGNKVFVLSCIDDGRPNALHLEEGITTRRLIPEGMRLRKQQRMVFRPLLSFLKENKIDVLLIMGQYSGFLASPVRIFSKTKFIFCDHGAIMNQWKDTKNRTMRIIASRLCDMTITLTDRSRTDYIKRLHINPKRIKRIYNWIDYDPDSEVKYDLSSKKIISVGRISEEKGFDLLIAAFEKVMKEHPDWHLDIYGDGEMYNDIASQIASKGIEQNVHLLGMDPEVINKYKNYSMYVMSSYKEGLPLVLLEAKVYGLPIVSFDIISGPKEIVRDRIDGFLVEPYNIDKLSEKILFLIENDNVRKSLSSNARGNLEQFSKEKILALWNDVFAEVIK